jgi:hypothetical protein
MVLGMAVITTTTCFSAFIFLTMYPDIFDLTSPIAPILVVGAISAQISYFLLSVVSFTSDAIF